MNGAGGACPHCGSELTLHVRSHFRAAGEVPAGAFPMPDQLPSPPLSRLACVAFASAVATVPLAALEVFVDLPLKPILLSGVSVAGVALAWDLAVTLPAYQRWSRLRVCTGCEREFDPVDTVLPAMQRAA